MIEILKFLKEIKSKQVVFFGTGSAAKELYELLPVTIQYCVDNNSQRYNTYFEGLAIKSPQNLLEENKDTLAIIIASQFYSDIARQLENMNFIGNVHFWNGFELLTTINNSKKLSAISGFNNVYSIFFEISGMCNAKCKYCQTGRNNNLTPLKKSIFVNIEEFKKSIIYMKNNEIINDKSTINLYNWGEPFLHPEFKKIIQFLNEMNLKIGLSTNASKPVFFDRDDSLKNLSMIIFSMPGFSQNSYDKIHGFSFEKIKKNIKDIMQNFRECGFKGDAHIAYHMYQFNLHELQDAFDFARQVNIKIYPRTAYINDFERAMKYLKNQLTYAELKSMGTDLFLNLFEKRLDEFNRIDKKYYVCKQFNILTIDEQCNVITCCGNSDVYKKVYEVANIQEVNLWRRNSNICKDCIAIGLSYMRPINYEELFGRVHIFDQLIVPKF